jgi:hypothetical protein
MFEVGQQVKIKLPFKDFFPDTYTISEIVEIDGQEDYAFLVGIESAFAVKFLEAV